ncbi:hypothetical protein ACU6QD_10730 [Corynebacterium glucuronolyticum]
MSNDEENRTPGQGYGYSGFTTEYSAPHTYTGLDDLDDLDDLEERLEQLQEDITDLKKQCWELERENLELVGQLEEHEEKQRRILSEFRTLSNAVEDFLEDPHDSRNLNELCDVFDNTGRW